MGLRIINAFAARRDSGKTCETCRFAKPYVERRGYRSAETGKFVELTAEEFYATDRLTYRCVANPPQFASYVSTNVNRREGGYMPGESMEVSGSSSARWPEVGRHDACGKWELGPQAEFVDGVAKLHVEKVPEAGDSS